MSQPAVGPSEPFDELDLLYGECLAPNRVDGIECLVSPQSMHALDASSAAPLSLLMKAAEAGLGVVKYVYCEMPILWVVDRNGKLWFAVEEIVEETTKRFFQARLRGLKVPEGYSRLGHPALIKGAEGRIGGEILFDTENSGWYITNASGRYGLVKGRQEVHLRNVRSLFSEFRNRTERVFYPGKNVRQPRPETNMAATQDEIELLAFRFPRLSPSDITRITRLLEFGEGAKQVTALLISFLLTLRNPRAVDLDDVTRIALQLKRAGYWDFAAPYAFISLLHLRSIRKSRAVWQMRYPPNSIQITKSNCWCLAKRSKIAFLIFDNQLRVLFSIT